MKYNFHMSSDLNSAQSTPAEAPALTPAQLVDLVGKLERDNVNLRRQVAWFQRQIFGQKSENAILSKKVCRAFSVALGTQSRVAIFRYVWLWLLGMAATPSQ